MKKKITQHLSKDPIMAGLVAKYPFMEERPLRKVHDVLLASIISQQLSTKVADVIRGRFLGLFGDDYPHPETLLATDVPTLRSIGLSYQKAAYLHHVAEFFQRENIHENRWQAMGDDEIIAFLTPIKGVGRWTVQMNLMFNLKRPDVFPVDDLGILNAMVALYKLEGPTTRELKLKMEEVATAWQPYRTYASWYLWRSLEG